MKYEQPQSVPLYSTDKHTLPIEGEHIFYLFQGVLAVGVARKTPTGVEITDNTNSYTTTIEVPLRFMKVAELVSALGMPETLPEQDGITIVHV